MIQDYNSYFEGLKGCVNLFPLSVVDDFQAAVDEYDGLDDEIRDYLLGTLSEEMKYMITTFYPIQLLTSKILTARPDELFDYLKPEANTSAIYTYEDAYDLLKDFPDESAKSILNKFVVNSSVKSRIIRAFQKSDKELFAEELEKTNEDYTDKLNSLYLLHFIFRHLILFLDYFKSFINDTELEDEKYKPISEMTNSVWDIPKKLGTKPDWTIEDSGNQIKLFSELLTVESWQELISNVEEKAKELGIYKFDLELGWVIYENSLIYYSIYLNIASCLYPEEKALYERIFAASSNVEYLEKIKKHFEEETKTELEEVEQVPSNFEFLPKEFYDGRYKKQNDYNCIGIIRQRIADSGIDSLTRIINFLADNGHIDNNDDAKRNWAYRLTGYHSEYALDGTHWYGETNLLACIISNFYESGNKWQRAEKLISLDGKMYRASTIRKTNEQDIQFAKLFLEIYGIDLLK